MYVICLLLNEWGQWYLPLSVILTVVYHTCIPLFFDMSPINLPQCVAGGASMQWHQERGRSASCVGFSVRLPSGAAFGPITPPVGVCRLPIRFGRDFYSYWSLWIIVQFVFRFFVFLLTLNFRGWRGSSFGTIIPILCSCVSKTEGQRGGRNRGKMRLCSMHVIVLYLEGCSCAINSVVFSYVAVSNRVQF